MTTDGLPTGSDINDLHVCPLCQAVGEFDHHRDDVPDKCDCGEDWLVYRPRATISVKREPDAMCHATHWRRHLDEWSGELTVRPYDPEKCKGDGPPWPVWIGSPPSSLAASPPEATIITNSEGPGGYGEIIDNGAPQEASEEPETDSWTCEHCRYPNRCSPPTRRRVCIACGYAPVPPVEPEG